MTVLGRVCSPLAKESILRWPVEGQEQETSPASAGFGRLTLGTGADVVLVGGQAEAALRLVALAQGGPPAAYPPLEGVLQHLLRPQAPPTAPAPLVLQARHVRAGPHLLGHQEPALQAGVLLQEVV